MAETSKPAVQSKTVWGIILQALAVALAAGAADLQANEVDLATGLAGFLPDYLSGLLPAVLSWLLGAILTYFGRQNAAQTGKKLKGIF